MGGFDQFVDAVAFGREKPKTDAGLGLYLSPEVIYISETHADKDNKLVVDHLMRVQVPPDAKGAAASTMTLSGDFLSDPMKIGGLIRQSMSQIRWNSKNVVVTLSHHLGLLRFFPMPSIERRFLNSAVPLEAKKYIPIPFDVLVHDFQAAPMPPDASGKARQGVLISVSQKKNLANIQGLLQFLRLNLVGVEVAPCSVLRLWQAVDPPKGPEPFVHAHFQSGAVRVLICDRGLPVFFREVFLGSEATLADQRKIDLSGCLAFAQKQLALTGISKIKLSGAPAALAPWKDALSQETGLAAEILDTSKTLSVKGADWGAYAAIGASTRSITPTAVTLDLTATDRVTEEERQTARDIIIVGALVAALIAGMGLFQSLTYRYRARELAEYAVDSEVKTALMNLSPPEIDVKLKAMRDQLDHLRAVTGAGQARPKISAVLRDIVELMPENVWLSQLNASDPLIENVGGYQIVLHGRTQGSSPSEEQALAFQFRDTLLRSEKIGKFFDVQMSLQGQAGAAQMGDLGLDPQSLAKKLEDTLEFTLELKAR